MDWNKLTISQIRNFLDVNATEIADGVTEETLRLMADLVFNEGSAKLTIPLRNLYIVTALQGSITQSMLEEFAGLLYIDPKDPDLLNTIRRIVGPPQISPNEGYSSPDSIPQDLLRRIALNVDYYDLKNYCQSSRTVYNLCKDNTFWLDKIAQDFGISPPVPARGQEQYLLIAAHHHYPVPNAEEYVYSFPDLFLLIFEAAKRGKSTTALQNKLLRMYKNTIYDRPIKHFLVNIATSLAVNAEFVRLPTDVDLLKAILVGALIVNNTKTITDILSTTPYTGAVFSPSYEIASAISSNVDPKIDFSWPYFQLQWAIMFSNYKMIDRLMDEVYRDNEEEEEIDTPLRIAARMGTPQVFDHLYRDDHDIDDSELLEEAFGFRNLPIVKKLIDKGEIPSEMLISDAIQEYPEILPDLWKLINLSPEDLRSYLNDVAATPHLDLAKTLIELGADNLAEALESARGANQLWMEKYLSGKIAES